MFETRDPAAPAWERWHRGSTYRVTAVPGAGAVESWAEVTRVDGPLVTYRETGVFTADGQVLPSESTLRFRERREVEADLTGCGFAVEEARGAPDRPGLELVFLARRPG